MPRAFWRQLPAVKALVGTFTSEPEHFAEWKTTEPVPEADVCVALGVTALSSQERLVAGMLAPERLLDLVRHSTLFMQAGTRTVKIVARYQQYRAVRRALERLTGGRPAQDGSWIGGAESSGTRKARGRA